MRTDESSLRHDPVSMSEARRAFSAHPLAAFVATGFGSGLSPVMPGTAGSVVGLAIGVAVARLLASHAGSIEVSLGLLTSGLVAGAIGVAVSGPVCRALAAEDPGCIVIDEIPLLPLKTSGAAAAAWAGAFVLFRLFDIVKPGPIRPLQRLPGGWGVVIDDVAAGLAAAVLLAAGGWAASRFGWI
jgi:phosphatidylglycerophosphatase A